MDQKQGFDYCLAVDLLCDEVAEEGFGIGGVDADNEDLGEVSHDTNGRRSESEESIHFPFLSDECFGWMVERERHYLPRDDYLKRLRSGEIDMGLRREALDWMLKACGHHKFGEMCFCSAVNYLDRFLSLYDLPAGKTWTARLVAVACLLLAAKMEEVNVPNSIDLQYGVIGQQQGEARFLFEARTVQRMEILLLNSLKWNIKPYTPLNFMEYFLRKTNPNNELPHQPWIARSIRIVSTTIKGVDFLEFRPSEIAAAVSMYISGEMQAMTFTHNLMSSSFLGLEKDRVMKCLELIQDLISTSCSSSTISVVTSTSTLSSSSSVENSPNGVLEAAFWSYRSDESTVGSCPSSSHTTPDGKRRKLDHNP